jgi:hypothetical protein
MSARVMVSATEGPCPESSKSMAMLYGGGA